jgi:hypothetical protein
MDVKRRQSSRLGAKLTALVGATLLLLAGGVFTTGCGGSTGGTPPPASTVAASPAATLAAHPSPAAVREFRGMLPYVYTSSLIEERPSGSTKTVGGVVQTRRAVWVFRRASSDPRLAGREVVVLNVDQRQSDSSAIMWGTSRLRNAGGTWVKRWTGGIAAGGDVHHFYGTLAGTGGYAGLVAHESGYVAEAGKGFTSDIRIVGGAWIETTDGSPVPPAPGPGTTPADWTPVVGIATLKNTAYTGPDPWILDVVQSDPRLNGRMETRFEEIGARRSDGSIDYRVACTVSNTDGTWQPTTSAAAMVRGPDPFLEHFQYLPSAGTGAYEGLVYHDFSYYPEPEPFVPGQTFILTGWIEEE